MRSSRPHRDTNVLGMNFLSGLGSWRVEGKTMILVPKTLELVVPREALGRHPPAAPRATFHRRMSFSVRVRPVSPPMRQLNPSSSFSVMIGRPPSR
jgi:hypothetical protein